MDARKRPSFCEAVTSCYECCNAESKAHASPIPLRIFSAPTHRSKQAVLVAGYLGSLFYPLENISIR